MKRSSNRRGFELSTVQQTKVPKTDRSKNLATMDEIKLKFLLMGKTGHGKSTTGNTLIKRRRFKTSTNVHSETKEVESHYSQFGKCCMLVVDGPGLKDTNLNKVEDKEAAAKNMDKALAMCYGGVDAFLFVIPYPFKFTEEERQCLHALKNIFGDTFFSHVIVVMTMGDNFLGAMEDEGRNISFKEWCAQQTDKDFIELYRNCDGRFVLFNNREKNEERNNEQIQELVDITIRLKEQYGSYTSQCFERAKEELESLIKDHKAPQLKEELQRNMSLLTADIEELAKRPSDSLKKKIRDRVDQLRTEIDIADKEYGVLVGLKKNVDLVEENINNGKNLSFVSMQIEETRQSVISWKFLGAVCLVAGVVTLGFVAPEVLALAVAAKIKGNI